LEAMDSTMRDFETVADWSKPTIVEVAQVALSNRNYPAQDSGKFTILLWICQCRKVWILSVRCPMPPSFRSSVVDRCMSGLALIVPCRYTRKFCVSPCNPFLQDFCNYIMKYTLQDNDSGDIVPGARALHILDPQPHTKSNIRLKIWKDRGSSIMKDTTCATQALAVTTERSSSTEICSHLSGKPKLSGNNALSIQCSTNVPDTLV
jgi:hypothetical protein